MAQHVSTHISITDAELNFLRIRLNFFESEFLALMTAIIP